MACHMVRLKEQLVVMGSAVLLAPGSAVECDTPGPEMPCVASDHHWYAPSPTDGSGGVSVPSAWILSATVSRLTMSAERSSMAAFGLQIVQLFCGGRLQKGGCGVPASTQRPVGVWWMRPLDASSSSVCSGSVGSQLHVVTALKRKAPAAQRHVGGVCPLLICEPAMAHTSFAPAPPEPHGHV